MTRDCQRVEYLIILTKEPFVIRHPVPQLVRDRNL
jgi:hypothetical protein